MTEKTNRANGARRRLVQVIVPAVMAALMTTAMGAASGPAQPGDEARAFEVRYTVTFSQEDLVFGENMGCDVVRLKDGDGLNEPGKPMLPARTVRIALPEGMRATVVRVLETEVVELVGEYRIATARAPLPTSRAGLGAPPVGAAASGAALSAVYPEELVELTHQTDLAGQAVALLRVYPVQYVAAEGRLILHTSISIVLEGEDGYVCGDYLPARRSPEIARAYEDMLRQAVVNPGQVRLRTAEKDPSPARGVGDGEYEYVIVTTSDWVDDFQPLAEWKTKKGVPTAIVTRQWIYDEGGYGGTNVEKIRQFVIDAHDTWGAMYFLLGGDESVLPYHERYLLSEYVPNDTHYADYDNDWMCEVHVGRASVVNEGMIVTFIDKVLTYEKNPPLTEYPQTAFFFGFDMYEYGSFEGEGTKTAIRNLYLPAGWTYRREFDSEPGTHKADVIAYLNQGNNLVNHIDHCGSDYIGTGCVVHDQGLSSSDMQGLYNGDRQGVFYSIGCWPCAFPEEPCIAEAYVRKANGGGVAFVGNTRYGWYMPYSDDGYSLGFDRAFFSSLFQQGHWRLGVCFSDHKNDYFQNDDYYRYIYTELTLLGDPELPIWTEVPADVEVLHDPTLPVGEYSEFPVNVSSGGSPLAGATVCLWKEGDVYEIQTTSGQGEATFGFVPESTGEMYVTVACHNYLPYEGQAEVTDGQGIPGDLDGDGDVDTGDLLALLADWGCAGEDCAGDVDGDGDTDTGDLLLLLANWG